MIVLAKYISFVKCVACTFFCLISDFIYVVCMQFINKRSINATKSIHYLPSILLCFHLRWLATKCVPFFVKIVYFFFSSIYFGNLSRCSFSCVFLKHFAWLFLVQKCTLFAFEEQRKNCEMKRFWICKINGNKFKINAQCVNKNLRWNKILHLAWIQLSIYWNSLGYCLCCAAEAHSKGILALCR